MWRTRYGYNQTPGAVDEMRRLRQMDDFIRDWATRNAATCTFEPARIAGSPVALPVLVAMNFSD